MKCKSIAIAVLCCLCLGVNVFVGNWLQAEEGLSDIPRVSAPFVSEPVTPGVSQEVWRLRKGLRSPSDPVRIFPRQPGKYATGITDTGPRMIDPLVQEPNRGSSIRTPSPNLSFDGMSLQNGGSGWPPDTIGDVGPNHYVQMVNTSFAIFDKSGNTLSGPTDINQLWQGEGNACERCNDGDPVVLYDPLADRWLLSQFAVCETPYYECIAISQTSDPTGAYYLYAFEITDFPDYPKFGVWPDAYYMSTNDDNGAYAFDRNRMLQGQSATYQRFQFTGNFKLPSDLDGSTAPPSGAPNYFYTMNTGNILELWEFHVDFTAPSNSTFALAQTLNTSSFNYGVCGFSFDCIPQQGTSQRLDVISEWPMWRLQYRNFGTHETLVGNFTVDVADFSNHAGIRWFELRKTGGGSWSIYQEGTYSPDTHHRWMGSVAMDGNGNIALGYSVSSGTLYPSIRYATRSASDATGTLQGEVTLVAGTASQTSSNRWGDYSSMNVDPSDDVTFWYTNEYLTNSGQGWQTRIGKFVIQTSVSKPTVTTTAVSSVTSTNASSGGNVTSDGGASVTARGVCWSTSANPTTSDNKTSDGTGTGSFTSSITGLSPNTTYHVRAYATNTTGTAYGDEQTFTTPATNLPVPDIKANGSDGSVTVLSGTPVSITVGLDPGVYTGANADWWIAASTPFNPPGDWYSYVHPAGWFPGINLCIQTPLFALSPYEVLNMTLPVGDYTFYFAVDYPDGIVTAEFLDSVQVEVR